MADINWQTSKEDTELLLSIVKRSEKMGLSLKKHRMQTYMDVTACHANGTPLRLADLLAADDFNFAHDVTGIIQHIDRTTGKLLDFFLPRYAVHQS